MVLGRFALAEIRVCSAAERWGNFAIRDRFSAVILQRKGEMGNPPVLAKEITFTTAVRS
jgi:hypothetical protein